MAGPEREHSSPETDEQLQARLEQEERDALGRIVHSILQYSEFAEWELTRWERNFSKLPEAHKALLAHIPKKCESARSCVHVNHCFFKALLSSFDSGDANEPPPHLADATTAAEDWHRKQASPLPPDMEKVNYVLKNLMRDWSADGAGEREQSYGRILSELKRVFADRPPSKGPPRVLVPGAGLGRLCLEVASMGYIAEGNEFSYYMLLTSSFMLNHAREENQWTIFPWVLTSSNNKSDDDQLKAVPIPDVCPASLVPGPGLMSMCGGDFVEVYSAPEYRGAFDCVATCFFIDTAHNVLEYLEIIASCLKEGGYWINLGPLLYHWADSHQYLPQEELSVELSLEDVKAAATANGLKCVREEFVSAAYTSNPQSMYRTVYTCAFWTMVKGGGSGAA